MKTLKLIHPIAVGQATIEELKFREYATAEDLLAFDERGVNQQTITLISNLTGNDAEIIKKLHVTDYRAADVIASELVRGDATEKNASES